jgi:hypothetical protein
MLVPYENLSPQARVWVYQADRLLLPAEVQGIQAHLEQFAAKWETHGQAVKAYAAVYHQAFIVLMSDTPVSGCSIDSSVHVLKEIEQQYKVKLFNRLTVAYMSKQDAQVRFANAPTFRALMAQKALDHTHIVFNNLVHTKADFESAWQVPIAQSSWATAPN